MQSNKIATLLAGIDTIPTLPAIVGQVTKTIADPKSSAQDLMEIIHPDQALTLKILKIANSAFYGRVREAGTLEQALMVLGFDEIRNLVISTALFNNFRSLKTIPSFDVGKFWWHSFVCGLAARIIAKEIKLSEGELFAAGLMHDIGKLALCVLLPDEFNEILERSGNGDLKTSSAEHQILGITHAEVGARLVKRWMLPQELVETVGYHHRPTAVQAQTAYPVVIHLADLLAHNTSAMEPLSGKPWQHNFYTPEMLSVAKSRGVSLPQDTASKFAAQLETQMDAQAGILDIFLS